MRVIYIHIHTYIYIYIYVIYIYACIFWKKGDRLGAMCEPLQNLILDIRVVTVTCNNCSLLTCLFKAGFHVSQCNSRSQFYPFPIILSRPRNRDRGKEKKEKKEREALPSSPLFRHHQEGKQIKLLPLLLPFLIFSTREKKKKKILSFPPPFF